ncbi:testis-specific Y-encoded protein 4-like [Myotis yumanensis]|uniref:testis-specific Y-encoded protein 4-like n=1 Tax=Myotis yumanensis TaxID=159337 RepID=UPI0038D405A7
MEAVEKVKEVDPQSEAKSNPEEEEPVQQEQAQSGPKAKLISSPLEVLQALPLEMELMNEEASRAFSRLRCRTRQRLKPYFELRSLNIGRIPGFWLTAVSLRVEEQDHKEHGTVQENGVREVRQTWGCNTMSLYFCSNPYFRNHVIVKEYLITLTDTGCPLPPPYQHCEREAYSQGHQDSSPSFFYWFSDHRIISKDLWLHSLKYYARTIAPSEWTGQGHLDAGRDIA